MSPWICNLRWAAAAAALVLGASSEAALAVEEVVVVFKTHFDIGYTDLARNVVNRYRTSMIDNALAVCRSAEQMPAEQRFVWTLSGWPMQQVLWPGQTPERRAQIERAVAAGRLVWHALPATLHTESLDLEDLVRGLGFSSRLARQFHVPLPRDAKMTDVPSHTWILATVLKHGGIEFMHIGCNGGSGMPDLPPLFWWEGPDGSRVLTMYSGDYGTGLRPPAAWPYKTWLALIHTGDNHGPPTADEVRRLTEQAARELPGVRIRMGRLSDFSDAILKEKPALPVIHSDPSDGWIHGIMQMPVETKRARNTRPQIAALEALGTLAGAWGVAVPPAEKAVAAAYEGSLLYGEHTWGFDAKAFPRLYGKPWEDALSAGRYARLIESWGEHAAYIRGAAETSRQALAANMQALARAVQVPGRRILVFNPLPWPRDGSVAIELPPAAKPGSKDAAASRPPAVVLQDAVSRRFVAAEVRGSSLCFLARDVPALGYRTYVVSDETERTSGGPPGTEPARATTLENALFRAELDPAHGTVKSLVDRRSGRELVDVGLGDGLGQYVYERYDSHDTAAYVKAYCRSQADWVFQDFAKPQLPPAVAVPHVKASPRDFRLTVQSSAVRTMATMNAPAAGQVPHAVTLRVTLDAEQPYVDIEWQVTDKRPDPWPEAGWLCFPLKVEGPAFRLGRLGSIVDPAKDICHGANFDNFCLNTGLNVLGGDGCGVGLCPIDSPIVGLGRPGLYRWSRRFEPRKPLVLVNLYNNLFGTNFQQWIGGTWSARVRLWAVAGGKAEAGLITPAWEARNPLLAAAADGPAGPLAPLGSGIELSRRGVLVTALGANPDGQGLLLRLWEQAGEDGPCRVRLPGPLHVAALQPCDLRGRPQGPPLLPRDGCFDVPLVHFAPASFLLRTR